jgi:uncharacterized protein YbjT (DUF2867 family)
VRFEWSARSPLTTYRRKLEACSLLLFVTGGTGYLGRPLIAELMRRGHAVRALVRPGSEGRLPQGAEPVLGDALRAESFETRIAPAESLVHLVGTPHPSPAKAAEFRSIDLVSIQASVAAAKSAGVRHLVYVSVAHPAPIMQAYIEARLEGERLIRDSGLSASILRPWYVLGEGHRWACALLPLYWIMERIPATRERALRLGLVTHAQMVRALIRAIETPGSGIQVCSVPEIRRA